MTKIVPPVSEFEPERLLDLSKLDLDYSALANEFEDLTKLAAYATGSSVSLINLIDSFTQWSISSHGIVLASMPREDSACQYTIATDADHFEVKNLAKDDRFRDKAYVKDPANLRYYMGVPLKSENGSNIGALCVLDTQVKELDPEKTEILKMIADVISGRLQRLKRIYDISNKLTASEEKRKTIASDIREPLAGIISVLQVILDKGSETDIAEITELITLIQKSAYTILNITDGVLDIEEERKLNLDQGNLHWLKTAIETLYGSQCRDKHIDFKVIISPRTAAIPFLKNNLLQIFGNLVAYAISRTSNNATITADLALRVNASHNILVIEIRYVDNGPENSTAEKLLNAKNFTGKNTGQTARQALWLVKKLVEHLNGAIMTSAESGKTKVIKVSIPQTQQ